MRVRWANDASLEAYYQPHGKRNRVICRRREQSIDDLFGAAQPRCDAVI